MFLTLKGSLGNPKWFFSCITVKTSFGTFIFKSVGILVELRAEKLDDESQNGQAELQGRESEQCGSPGE